MPFPSVPSTPGSPGWESDVKIGLFVPSRERPQNIGRLAQTMRDTCQGDTTLIIGLDTDDPTRPQYPEPDGTTW